MALLGVRIAAAAAALVMACWVLPARAADSAAELLQFVAQADSGGAVRVTVGALPGADIGGVPLPGGAHVVGSVAGADGRLTVYYRAGAPSLVLKDYERQLAAAGWRGASLPLHMGGFLPGALALATMAVYCGPGMRAVSVREIPGTGELVLSLSPAPSAGQPFSACSAPTAGGLATIARSFQAPLPALAAPAGATMAPSPMSFSPFAHSSAIIRSEAAPAALLADFAAQFQAAGWVAGARTAAPGIAAQVFTQREKDGTTWRASLLLAAAGPGVVEATVNALVQGS